MILFKPLFTLLILVLFSAALFSQASRVDAHPDTGTDWVNDWLRFSVKNDSAATITNVTVTFSNIVHPGHGHWPGTYKAKLGNIAAGAAKTTHLPDHITQSGPECTPPENYTFNVIVAEDGSGAIVFGLSVTPGASTQNTVLDFTLTSSIIQKGLGAKCSDPQPSPSPEDPRFFPNAEDDGPVAVKVNSVGGATSYIVGGSDSAASIAILASSAAAIVILGAGSWYTRKRWLGNRS